ncbi:hypothetical protein B0H14DRAFT_3154815 [Mycena olivaceomarginata]|nr:hypothetical protein B0H14DRAFT_3154815 [Mycena olivaceomarginata]
MQNGVLRARRSAVGDSKVDKMILKAQKDVKAGSVVLDKRLLTGTSESQLKTFFGRPEALQAYREHVNIETTRMMSIQNGTFRLRGRKKRCQRWDNEALRADLCALNNRMQHLEALDGSKYLDALGTSSQGEDLKAEMLLKARFLRQRYQGLLCLEELKKAHQEAPAELFACSQESPSIISATRRWLQSTSSTSRGTNNDVKNLLSCPGSPASLTPLPERGTQSELSPSRDASLPPHLLAHQSSPPQEVDIVSPYLDVQVYCGVPLGVVPTSDGSSAAGVVEDIEADEVAPVVLGRGKRKKYCLCTWNRPCTLRGIGSVRLNGARKELRLLIVAYEGPPVWYKAGVRNVEGSANHQSLQNGIRRFFEYDKLRKGVLLSPRWVLEWITELFVGCCCDRRLFSRNRGNEGRFWGINDAEGEVKNRMEESADWNACDFRIFLNKLGDGEEGEEAEIHIKIRQADEEGMGLPVPVFPSIDVNTVKIAEVRTLLSDYFDQCWAHRAVGGRATSIPWDKIVSDPAAYYDTEAFRMKLDHLQNLSAVQVLTLTQELLSTSLIDSPAPFCFLELEPPSPPPSILKHNNSAPPQSSTIQPPKSESGPTGPLDTGRERKIPFRSPSPLPTPPLRQKGVKRKAKKEPEGTEERRKQDDKQPKLRPVDQVKHRCKVEEKVPYIPRVWHKSELILFAVDLGGIWLIQTAMKLWRNDHRRDLFTSIERTYSIQLCSVHHCFVHHPSYTECSASLEHFQLFSSFSLILFAFNFGLNTFHQFIRYPLFPRVV